MIMWIMSDRTIPRSLPLHGRLRRPHLPAGQRRRQVDLRQVPLEAQAGHAVGGLERGGEDQRRRSRLPSPRSLGRDPDGRLSRVGAGPAAVRSRNSPTASTSTCSTRPRSSPRSMLPVRRVGRLVLDRVVDNFFAETEQVAFCTQNVVPGHRLHQRSAAAGAELLLSRHSAEAARQPELHRDPGQPAARLPGPSTSSRTATCGSPWHPRAAPTTSRIRGARARASRRRTGFRSYPRRGERRQAAAAAGELRRPLQPGAAVLRQPDRGRAAAYRGGAHVRAEQGRDAGDPRADGLASAQHRRGAGPQGRRTACA